MVFPDMSISLIDRELGPEERATARCTPSSPCVGHADHDVPRDKGAQARMCVVSKQSRTADLSHKADASQF
jgi:hypothetical protein